MSNRTDLLNKWGEMINEAAPGLSANKKYFVAQIAENKEMINESGVVTNLNSHGLNSNGIGSITLPTNVPASFAGFGQQTPGSGDVPVTMLSMAMSVAATTVGFDLLPTIPIYNQSILLEYIDYIYGGGRLDEQNHAPEFVTLKEEKLRNHDKFKVGEKVTIDSQDFKFAGFTRLEGYPILKVDGALAKPIKDLNTASVDINGTVVSGVTGKFELTRAVENHLGAFAAFGDLTGEGQDRAIAEKGTRSVLEIKTYSKLVRTKEYSVLGSITKQQARSIKDMGLDAFPALKVAMQNEISQSLNKEILGRMKALGVTTHLMLQKSQGVNLNLFVGPAATLTKQIAQFKTSPLFDKSGVDVTASFADAANVETNSAAENLYSRQRRIKSRILAAAALIGQVSNWGAGDFAVVNSQLLAAVKESKGYQASTIEGNALIQDTKALYFAGEVAGVKLYCDPNMSWTDTTVVVGRTGKSATGNDVVDLHEGLTFLPYDLASSVDIIAEGTMAPKCSIDAIYAIAEVGIRPELAYFTFVCDNGFGGWV